MSHLTKNIARNSPASRRKGGAAVEMAMVLPIFVLFISAMFELGWGLMTTQILTNASRIGARQGTIDPSLAETASREYLSRFSLDSANVAVTEATSPPTVQVEVDVLFTDVSFVPSFFAQDARLRASTVMLKEQQ